MRVPGFLRRLAARGRTIDLDNRVNWPPTVSVLERDDSDPTVIAVADATVFPDGSVSSRGRWLISTSFGLKTPSGQFSQRLTLKGEHGFVPASLANSRKLAERIGPQLAALGRLRPGIGVFIPSARDVPEGVFAQCSVSRSGYLLDNGAAYRVDSAVFARIPSESETANFAPRVAVPSRTGQRTSSRITVTGTFDVDAALRNRDRLPAGVDLISRPDYVVDTISVDNHRVFDGRRWRRQSADVVREQPIGPHLLVISDAIVTPNEQVILADGTLLTGTYFGGPRLRGPIEGQIESALDGRTGLAVMHAPEFGHFLLQAAPRIDALARFDRDLPLLMSEYHWNDTDAIVRSGARVDRVRRIPRGSTEHFVRVPELVVSTHLQPGQRTAGADPRWFAEFVSRFTAGLATDGERRVHMARRIDSGARGGCLNRDEIHAIADEFGYETVFPETMSFDDQIRLATATTEMFGEQGSALTWAMVMKPGSEVLVVQNRGETRNNRYVTYHNPVMAARGSRFSDIGAVRAGNEWHFEIDPTTVRRALERRR